MDATPYAVDPAAEACVILHQISDKQIDRMDPACRRVIHKLLAQEAERFAVRETVRKEQA